MNELREPFETTHSKGAMFYAVELRGKIKQDYFSPDFWLQQSATELLTQGRTATYKVRTNEFSDAWVLRQYYRGGLFGKFIRRSYFYRSEAVVRSLAELRLLTQLYELGLSVPKPIAAIYWRTGLVYRAALLTQFIDDSQTLSTALANNEVIDWHTVAYTIKAIHEVGCMHGDLNAHNILLHDKQVTIIDFDKSRILKGPQPEIHKKNLMRLKRSILKVTNWSEQKLSQQWEAFMQAYNSA